MKSRRRLATAGVAFVLVVAGGGAAIAATSGGDPVAESEAAVADAAEELGVTPARLTDALEEALKHRVDAAVDAGRLTEEEGEELKERIDAGEVPLLGLGPGRGHHHGRPGLDAAASYLGMTESALHDALRSGSTLAEVAEERGKSVDELVDAMVAEAKERIEAAVDAGRLTRAQADDRLAELEQRIAGLVERELPARPHRLPGRFGSDSGAGVTPPFEDGRA